MTFKLFYTLYNQLNQKQRKAVDSIEGPVMVVAGPGTGKTQVLTLRIANILRLTDTPPDAILALTFTESGAYAMRKRLLEIMGGIAYRVHIHTFHSYCHEVIRSNPDAFPRIIGGTSIDAIRQIEIMEKVFSAANLQKLKPFGNPYYYVRPALKAISDLKRERICSDEFQTKADEEKSRELAVVYREYEKELERNIFYDFDDMIIDVVKALERDETLCATLGEDAQYILADEYQDTNGVQNYLLELLAGFHKSPNIFVVGDSKQAIYRFQGASLQNFLSFSSRYPESIQIPLLSNYRSLQPILDAAHELIPEYELISERRSKAKDIALVRCQTKEAESSFIAAEIKKLRARGASFNEITVLYRDNKDVAVFQSELARENIPYVVESDENILEHGEIKKFLVLLYAVIYFGDDEKIIPLLHLDFLHLDELMIYRAIHDARNAGESICEFLSRKKHFSSVMRKISEWHKASFHLNLMELLECVMCESGFLASSIGRGKSYENLESLDTFFDEARAFLECNRSATPKDFLLMLELYKRHDIQIRRRTHSERKEGVRLMTVHRSKGLEFEHVFLTGAYLGHFGDRRAISHFSLGLGEGHDNEDEKRLFYVALTRARADVTITYPEFGAHGEPLLPSRFVEDIGTCIVKKEYSDPAPRQILKYAKTKKASAPEEERKYFRALFDEHGLSVTALNNYLACPWRYFYSNLLRIPKTQNRFAVYGTAVHGALKEFFERWRKGDDASDGLDEKWLVDVFERRLKKEIIKEDDLRATREVGGKSLAGYYRVYVKSWLRHVLCEWKVKGVMLGDVRLTGNIDKIEYLNDNGDVNVVDYKTRKPLTRNEILGKTKNSTGDYIRQLVFYKLLLERFPGKKFNVLMGEIDFIEPDAKGRYKKERFDISIGDVKELENTIQKVAIEIRALSFWNKFCDDKKCEYCELRRMMKSST